MAELLGKRNFEWVTYLEPGGEDVWLRIDFDPAVLSASRIVDATVQAMRRYPDPKYPGPVEVVYESEEQSQGP